MDLKGYSGDVVEKMGRLCDLLSAIGDSEFVSRRLSLYGGTALNVLYLDLPRLSEDLDFNYRHIDGNDWGLVRERLDEYLKSIIRSQGYKDEDLKISPHYNHCRFGLNYTAESGTRDQLKIEIGYMRRFANLKEERRVAFRHLTRGTNVVVLTPTEEELFANKFATMISRSRTYLNIRDVYDVHSISGRQFDRALFLDQVALEAMLMDLSQRDLSVFKERALGMMPTGRIDHLVLRGDVPDDIIARAGEFSKDVIQELEEYKLDTIRENYMSTGKLDVGAFHFPERLHPGMSEHPQLLWLKQRP